VRDLIPRGGGSVAAPGDASTYGLLAASFLASLVEFVEALTIVLAMGMLRSWRSALTGVGLALVVLAGVTAAAGYALVNWFPQSALQLVVGMLLAIFGLQWLRKAILRASGLKELHDEDAAFETERRASQAAGVVGATGLDWTAFVVSFKGVLLEGMEVVFIVITFGLGARNIPGAAFGAAAAFVVVVVAGVIAHRPLSRVPENALKFGVGLLLTTFGTFWSVEGLGVFRSGRAHLEWPGGEVALPVLLVLWIAVSWLSVRWLRAWPARASRTLSAKDTA
jgi:Ca2+/H+ antiporter, TMEM165/GDT1 family